MSRNTKQEKEAPATVDTVAMKLQPDTLHVRSNPYDIRGDKAERRTIDIVKDKPIRVMPRRR